MDFFMTCFILPQMGFVYDMFYSTPSIVPAARNGGRKSVRGVTLLVKTLMLKLELKVEKYFLNMQIGVRKRWVMPF